MSDKFSFYQTEGLWGIIENASDEKQTSIKSYFGSDLIIKRLNEQAEQIDQLKQQLAEKDKEIEKLKQQYTILENENGKLAKELIVKNYKKAQKEVSFGIQLAIQKLEKVKEEMDLNGNSYCEIRQGTSPHNPTDYAWFNYVKFRNYLNQQIKELKGE